MEILLFGFTIFRLTLVMLYANSALIASYSFDFALTVPCGHVTFDMIVIIGFETTLAAVETLLVKMERIIVIF